jgi:hypothetical protein
MVAMISDVCGLLWNVVEFEVLVRWQHHAMIVLNMCLLPTGETDPIRGPARPYYGAYLHQGSRNRRWRYNLHIA